MAPDFALLKPIAEKWRNYDPRLYEKFLRTLDKCVFDVTVAVTEAPNDQILQAQGRAQQARKFMQVFVEAVEQPPASPPTAASQ